MVVGWDFERWMGGRAFGSFFFGRLFVDGVEDIIVLIEGLLIGLRGSIVGFVDPRLMIGDEVILFEGKQR